MFCRPRIKCSSSTSPDRLVLTDLFYLLNKMDMLLKLAARDVSPMKC